MPGSFSFMRGVILSFLLVFSFQAAIAADFSEVQEAAGSNQYRRVVDLLTTMLEEEELEPEDQVTALSNRGIAYSLLDAYALAFLDLEAALAIDPNHGLTLNHMGLLMEQVRDDYAAAAEYFERGVQQRFAASYVNLANLYRDGLGVKKNGARAAELYEQAARQNYQIAFVPLAKLYLEGDGVKRNSKRAFELLEQAASANVSEAHYELAQLYESGVGVPVDLPRAAYHYRVAAIDGHVLAQSALGYLYRSGRGVEQDFSEAAAWYLKAANQGEMNAMNRLAWLLAGCPTKDVCDGGLAVSLATSAVKLSPTPGFLDTLAASYARNGQFDKAIELIEGLLDTELSSDRRREFNKRLGYYRQGIPNQL